MYPFTQFLNHKNKTVIPAVEAPVFLLHSGEPASSSDSNRRMHTLAYRSRYFARRRLMRNIRRMRNGQL